MSGPSAPSKPGTEELVARAAKVQLVIFDVDGVLTDGGLYFGASGEMFKRFDVKDNHGLVMARITGLETAILTGRRSDIVNVRAKEVGITTVFQGYKDKGQGLVQLLEDRKIAAENCAYMGDDVNDLAPMAQVGLPACPADAVVDVRQAAWFVSQYKGGQGAARELLELILKAQNKWADAIAQMSSLPSPAKS